MWFRRWLSKRRHDRLYEQDQKDRATYVYSTADENWYRRPDGEWFSRVRIWPGGV